MVCLSCVKSCQNHTTSAPLSVCFPISHQKFHSMLENAMQLLCVNDHHLLKNSSFLCFPCRVCGHFADREWYRNISFSTQLLIRRCAKSRIYQRMTISLLTTLLTSVSTTSQDEQNCPRCSLEQLFHSNNHPFT